MKRLIVAIIMSFFIIAAILTGNFIIKDSYSSLDKNINEIIDKVLADDYQKAFIISGEFSKDWENEKKYLTIFSNHEPIDNITFKLSELIAGIKTEDKSLSLSKSFEISTILKSIKDEQIFNFEAFF